MWCSYLWYYRKKCGKVKAIYKFQHVDQVQCFNSGSRTSFTPRVLTIKSVKSGWGHEESINWVNFSKQNPLPQKGVSSDHIKKAGVKVMAFPSGDEILSPSQKGQENLGDWLAHHFPKATQVRLPILHWSARSESQENIPKGNVICWRELLSVNS